MMGRLTIGIATGDTRERHSDAQPEREDASMADAAQPVLPLPLPTQGGGRPGAATDIPQRFYSIAGLTIAVSADLEITDTTFAEKFLQFEIPAPVGEVVRIHHHFSLPDLEGVDLGELVHDRRPWRIYRRDGGWFYVVEGEDDGRRTVHRVAQLTADHTACRMYSTPAIGERFSDGRFVSLALFATDQVLLAPVLADRRACYVHSSGVILDGKGLLFVGHSEAGKSTASGFMARAGQLLCDDRNIVRRWPDGFRVHGTWSHGELPIVSPESARLVGILFLRKAPHNRVERLHDPQRVAGELLPCVVRPLITASWWHKTLDLFDALTSEVPCYLLEFDQSGGIVGLLRGLVAADR
jgi:hypothetical protein